MFGARRDVRRIMAVALLIALSGCAGGEDGLPSITAEEANEQYREEAASWDLPPGWDWPQAPYSGQGPDGAPAVYGTEIGRVDASRYWYCAWNRELVAADTAEERQVALAHVLRVRDTPYYQIGLEDTGSTDARLEAAEAGDLSELANYTEINCPEGPEG